MGKIVGTGLFVRNIWIFACALLAVALQQPAHAAEAIVFAPPAAWVEPIAVPPGKPSQDDGAVRALLDESQVYFGPQGESYYFQTADQVLTAEGLEEMGLVSQSWDPLLDTLTIHSVEIIRDGKVIDALKEGEPFSIIRREQNLNYAMLDGRLTATKQLEDLRIGDIVRVAMTITTKDPSLGGHSELWDTLNHEGIIARVRYRYIWPKGEDLRWRTTAGFNKVLESQTALGTELVADGYDVRMPLVPRDAPDRFNTLGEIEITSFKSWQELSALFAPYYARAATLSADSPVRAEAAKIRASNASKVAQASAALALVEQRVRYLALTMGQAGYQPAQADLTWTRRFGDCKGKTTLLIALLTELGIDAEPALVRTTNNDGLDKRFPRAGLFDHVIARAQIDGRTYWLDATRTGDASIESLSVPPYLWALPLRAPGAQLEPLVMTRPTRPTSESIMEFDETAGLDADNPVVMTQIYRGEDAMDAFRKLTSGSRVDAERTLREGSQKDMPWLTIDKVKLPTELGADGSLTYVITGKSKSPWSNPGAGRQRTVALGDTAFTTSFEKRQPDRTPTDAPYSLAFPYFARSTIVVKLPRGGAGFEMVGPDVDKTVAGMTVRRKTTMKEGVVTSVLDVETVASEVGYKEAIAAGDVLGRLPTAKEVVVRAPLSFASTGKEADRLLADRPADAQAYVLRAGRHLANARPTAALADANQALALSPDDADAMRLKALSLVNMGDLDGALAILDKAIASGYSVPAAHLVRSVLYKEYQRYEEALADANEFIALLPNYPGAFTNRAEIYREMDKTALALDDVDAALKLNPDDEATQRLRLLYALPTNAPLQPWRDQMIERLTGLLASHKDDGELYAERAGLLARSGRYDLARKDFDKAISAAPIAANYQARAQFLADHGQDDAAVDDFNKAIKLEPTAGRYSARGAYYATAGDYPRAHKDIEAALNLDPDNAGMIAALAVMDIKLGAASEGFSRIEALSLQDPASFDLMRLKASVHDAGKAYDLALADLSAIEARKGNTPAQLRALQLMRSHILGQKGDHAGAVVILDQMIAKRPADENVLNQRCWERATGKIELTKAKADCDAALALTSSSDAAPILDSLGLVYLQLGRDADALQSYDRALGARGRYPTSLYGRALAKARLGDMTGARTDVAAALKLDPEVSTEFLGYQLAAP